MESQRSQQKQHGIWTISSSNRNRMVYGLFAVTTETAWNVDTQQYQYKQYEVDSAVPTETLWYGVSVVPTETVNGIISMYYNSTCIFCLANLGQNVLEFLRVTLIE